jgi:hypothetical protein
MKIIKLIKYIFVASKFVSCATSGTRATFFLTLDWVVLLNDKSRRNCGRVKEENFLSYAAPGLTRKCKDYIKSRRYLFSFDMLLIPQTLNACFAIGFRVDVRDSLEYFTIRHEISKKATRVRSCITEGEYKIG